MNNETTEINQGPMPPMSSENVEIAQTMLQTGMMDAPAMPGPIGAIDRFEVIKLLGQGGMGQVMLAREPITDASVAIKIINPSFAKEQWAVRRFLTEAQHMYRMSHPNILKVLEVSDRKAGPYYVMPYIEGGSLAERIKPGQPLSKDEIVPIARQIADALKYAHSRGIIHRDLKPANILIDAAGRAYLTDFGLLRTVFNDSMIDVSKRSVEGTPTYLSPSAAEGKADDTRGDIYAFGAVLYEMLTGLKPYDGPDPESIIKKIIAGPPRPIREINPEAPADLVQIAENCMARELRDRYAEMADVLCDIERLSTGGTILGSHGTAPKPQAQNRDVRRLRLKRTLLYIAGVCMIIAAFSAYIGGEAGLCGLLSAIAVFNVLGALSIDMKIEQLLRSPEALDMDETSSEKFWKFWKYVRIGLAVVMLLWTAVIFGLLFKLKVMPHLRIRQPTGFFEHTPGFLSMSQAHNVRLLPNGDAMLTADSRFTNKDNTPMLTYSFIATPSNIVAVLDKTGNALPFDVVREDTHYRYTARLQSPILPGEEFIGKIVVPSPMAAKLEGDIWVYRKTQVPGPETRFTETVLLPEGAELVSVNPKPSRQIVERGSITLVFEMLVPKGGAYKSEIRYRLAGAGPSAPASSANQVELPLVTETYPHVFNNDVPSSLDHISVTFNRKMHDGSWSWCDMHLASYPAVTGTPWYNEDRTVCTLPVKLQPGTAYAVHINLSPYKSFVSENGRAVPEYMLVFSTLGKDGKPTPLPDDLVKRAKEINRAHDRPLE